MFVYLGTNIARDTGKKNSARIVHPLGRPGWAGESVEVLGLPI